MLVIRGADVTGRIDDFCGPTADKWTGCATVLKLRCGGTVVSDPDNKCPAAVVDTRFARHTLTLSENQSRVDLCASTSPTLALPVLMPLLLA